MKIHIEKYDKINRIIIRVGIIFLLLILIGNIIFLNGYINKKLEIEGDESNSFIDFITSSMFRVFDFLTGLLVEKPTIYEINIQVSQSSDDAEERLDDNNVDLISDDLDLVISDDHCSTYIECGECKDKVSNLTLQYKGSESALIKVKQKNGEVVFEGTIEPGEEFSFSGTEKGTLGTEIVIYIDDIENTKIHTSCSKPIGIDLVSGDFEIIDGYSLGGGKLCVCVCDVCDSGCGECKDKVSNLTLQYNGNQSALITVEQRNGEIVFNETVELDGQFSFTGTDRGTLGTEIVIYVDDIENTKIHTSCSKPIGIGLVSGDFEIIDGYSLGGGKLCAMGEIGCSGSGECVCEPPSSPEECIEKNQEIGIRFNNVNIPKGAIVNNAYIEFEIAEYNDDITNLNIYIQDADNPGTFTTSNGDITGRTKILYIQWINVPVLNVNDKLQTPDFTSIVQEIINREEWKIGNAMVFIINGDGKRIVKSYDGEPSAAPLLVINYSADQIDNPPVINLISPSDGTIDMNGLIIFEYSVDDESNIASCSLILNDENVGTETNVERNVVNNFKIGNISDGDYLWRVECYDENNNKGISEEYTLSVVRTNPASLVHLNETVNDANNNSINITMDLIDAGTEEVDYSNTGENTSIDIEKGIYNLRYIFNNYIIDEIIFYGVNISEDISQIVDVDEIENDMWAGLYGILPNFEFEYAEVTVTATGDDLFKCTDWDFYAQNCYGRWKKLKNLVPGEQYTFNMTGGDPGFGESNFTIIVIDRQDYLENYTENITNQSGNIVDANITIIDHVIEKIYVYSHDETNPNNEIKIDEIKNQETKWEERYAIDASNLNFTNAIVRITAQGDKLWKCVNWNITSRVCIDNSWTFVQETIPGQVYFLNLTPGDPAFGEGDGSIPDIMTDKPYYGVGQTVYMAGFDWSNNSNITINITYGSESINGYPKTILSNSTGGINDNFVLAGDADLGFYTVFAYETLNSSANDTTQFEVAELYHYPENSLIIPMDSKQSADIDDVDFLRAYGMLYRFVNNSMPVDIIISPECGYFDAIDIDTNTTYSDEDYCHGTIIVTDPNTGTPENEAFDYLNTLRDYYDPIESIYPFRNVVVHNGSGYIREEDRLYVSRTLELALFDDEARGNFKATLDESYVPYTQITEAQIIAGSLNFYDLMYIDHYDFTNAGDPIALTDTIKNFTDNGGSLSLECKSIETLELYVQYFPGIVKGPGDKGKIRVYVEDDPITQTHSLTDMANEGGAVPTLDMSGVSINYTIYLVDDNFDTNPDIVKMVGRRNETTNSYILYAGGHIGTRKGDAGETPRNRIAVNNFLLVVEEIKIEPDTVNNLDEIAVGTTWIEWNWTNPKDSDLDYVEIWINGTFYANVSYPGHSINVTGLNPSTLYEIGTRTVDIYGNINDTWMNDTASTLSGSGNDSNGGGGGGGGSTPQPKCGNGICEFGESWRTCLQDCPAPEHEEEEEIIEIEDCNITIPVEENYTGTCFMLTKRQKIFFNFRKIEHFIVVENINPDNVEVSIHSATQYATLLLNQPQEFDMNDNGIKDIIINLDYFDYEEQKVNVTVIIKRCDCPECSEWRCFFLCEKIRTCYDCSEETNYECQEYKEKKCSWLWCLIVLMIMIAAILYTILKKQKQEWGESIKQKRILASISQSFV